MDDKKIIKMICDGYTFQECLPFITFQELESEYIGYIEYYQLENISPTIYQIFYEYLETLIRLYYEIIENPNEDELNKIKEFFNRYFIPMLDEGIIIDKEWNFL